MASSSSKMTKTNALRILEANGVPFSIHEYDASDGKIDGVTVAAKIGCASESVYKTLVTRGKTTGLNVFVIPVDYELDLKKAAVAANDKFIEMIKSKDLEPLTGYIHGGCSPVGMKKQFPTFIEESAELLGTMVVSAGRIGLQAELSPNDLAKITGAVFADLV
jgi:Cys-tRNA(Pro)/Cys-tRNA(Cys) deacylase